MQQEEFRRAHTDTSSSSFEPSSSSLRPRTSSDPSGFPRSRTSSDPSDLLPPPLRPRPLSTSSPVDLAADLATVDPASAAVAPPSTPPPRPAPPPSRSPSTGFNIPYTPSEESINEINAEIQKTNPGGVVIITPEGVTIPREYLSPDVLRVLNIKLKDKLKSQRVRQTEGKSNITLLFLYS